MRFRRATLLVAALLATAAVSPPYLLRLYAPTGDGELLFFGEMHLNDPAHPQMRAIEDQFAQFRPTIALTEGGNWPLYASRDEAIRRAGGMGLVRFLANGAGAEWRNLDPSWYDAAQYARRSFSDEQVAVCLTLTIVPQFRRQAYDEPFDVLVQKELDKQQTRDGIPNGPHTIAAFDEAVRRLLPQIENWRAVDTTASEPNEGSDRNWCNHMSAGWNRFRNAHMRQTLTDAVRSGGRVFAIAGFSHVTELEPQLRDDLAR